MKKLLAAFLILCGAAMGQQTLGTFAEDDTIHFLWTTVDSAGEPVTRSTDGTVSVYKDNGTTQSTAGVTDAEDFDGLTGVHAVTIDLSADAFYATGSNYIVTINGAVVDGVTVNAPIAYFTIQNEYMRGTDGAALASAWTSTRAGYVDKLNVSGTLAHSDAANTYKADVSGLATSAELGALETHGDSAWATATGFSTHSAADVWSSATRTLTAATNITSTGGTTVPQTGDAYARLGAPTGASVSADVAAVKAETAAIVADTNELQADWANGGRLDTILDTAAAAGDPWSIALPGAYAAGTAGYIIGTNLDAAVSGVSGGSGNTPVNHDTGGSDVLAYKTDGGAGIEAATVQAYVKSEYDAGVFTLRGITTTNALGEWNTNLMLNSGVEYTIVFYKPGAYGPDTKDVTP